MFRNLASGRVGRIAAAGGSRFRRALRSWSSCSPAKAAPVVRRPTACWNRSTRRSSCSANTSITGTAWAGATPTPRTPTRCARKATPAGSARRALHAADGDRWRHGVRRQRSPARRGRDRPRPRSREARHTPDAHRGRGSHRRSTPPRNRPTSCWRWPTIAALRRSPPARTRGGSCTTWPSCAACARSAR